MSKTLNYLECRIKALQLREEQIAAAYRAELEEIWKQKQEVEALWVEELKREDAE